MGWVVMPRLGTPRAAAAPAGVLWGRLGSGRLRALPPVRAPAGGVAPPLPPLVNAAWAAAWAAGAAPELPLLLA